MLSGLYVSSYHGQFFVSPPVATKHNAVILFSGGVDSFVSWRLYGKPRPVYFRLGHRYEAREMQTIGNLMQACDGLDVQVSDALRLGPYEQPDAYIPFRNLLLATCAAIGDDANIVFLGALQGEATRDKSAKFFRDISSALSYLKGRRVEIVAPTRGMTKTDLVEAYLRYYPDDKNILRITRSCYTATNLPQDVVGCGECMACFRRWVAMTNNGIDEMYLCDPAAFGREQMKNKANLAHWLKKLDRRELLGIIRNNIQAARALRL